MSESGEPENKGPEPTPSEWAAMAAVFVIMLWALGVAVIYTVPGKLDRAAWGQFGDAFGVLNSLFTGLGIAGAIAALILQNGQIKEQRIQAERQSGEQKAQLERQINEQKALLELQIQEQANQAQRQIDAARELTKAQTYFELTRYLEGYHKDRETVYNEGPYVLKGKPRETYSFTGHPFDKVAFEHACRNVCASFNTAGLLGKQGLVDHDLLVSEWSYAARRCYALLDGWVQDRRNEYHSNHWEGFPWLANQATERK